METRRQRERRELAEFVQKWELPEFKQIREQIIEQQEQIEKFNKEIFEELEEKLKWEIKYNDVMEELQQTKSKQSQKKT